MEAVRWCARSYLRRHVAATVLLAAMIALAAGVAMAAFTGARRNHAALPDFIRSQQIAEAHLFVVPESEGGTGTEDQVDEAAALRALPYVEQVHRLVVGVGAGHAEGSTNVSIQLGTLPLPPSTSAMWGHPIVVDGRMPGAGAGAAAEIAIDEEFAAREHLSVGDAYVWTAFSREQFSIANEPDAVPEGPERTMRVVGIVRFPSDLRPLSEDTLTSRVTSDMYVSPAYWTDIDGEVASFGVHLAIDLRSPGDWDRLAADALRLFGEFTYIDHIDPSVGITGDSSGVSLAGERRTISVQTGALWIFGTLVALAGVALAGQAVAREARTNSADAETWLALGLSRRQLTAIELIRGAAIAVGAALVAVALAITLSPLTPIGLARRAETNPGVDVDPLVLVLGVIALVAVTTGITALAAWRVGRERAVPDRLRRSRITTGVINAGLPPAASVGALLAFRSGRGRRSIPVRATIGATALMVVVIVAAQVLLTSFHDLEHHPEGFGVTWDATVAFAIGGATPDAEAAALATLAADPNVDSYRGVETLTIALNGHDARAVLLGAGRGDVGPAVRDGRAPTGPTEIGVGGDTLRAIGADVGDEIDVNLGYDTARLRVTGEMIMNSGTGDDLIRPGLGAVLSEDAVFAIVPPEVAEGSTTEAILVRFRSDVDKAAALRRLRDEFPGQIAAPHRGTDVDGLDQVAGLPELLAALAALLGLGTALHALVSAVRRRRRDLATLKAVGFLRRQTAAVIAWQASAFAAVALVIGLPLGVAAGNWSWVLITGAIWIDAATRVSTVALLVVALACAISLNLLAVGPAWRASRLPAAAALRSE